MRPHSIYMVTCPCGHEVQGETPALTCQHCGAEIRVQWPVEEAKRDAAGR